MVITTYFTFICCVYKEKLLKTTHNKERSVHKNSEVANSTRIIKKWFQFQTNHSDIIINDFSTYLYKAIFHNIFYLFYIGCTLNDDFFVAMCRWSLFHTELQMHWEERDLVAKKCPLKYIVYKTSKKYYEISALFECVEKLSLIMDCNN